jgi:ELWxxDGT repeat protein
MQAMEGVVKLSIRQPRRLVWLALLLAASGVLLSTSGAQAAPNRGAVLVKDINPGRSPSVTEIHSNCGCTYNGGQLTDVRGTLYFSANDGKHGYELWRSDGTARGTRMVKDINPGTGWSNLYGITAVNGIIFFSADDSVHGVELWRSDGTARGTSMVNDIRPGSQGSGPFYLTNVRDTLYFTAFDGTNPGLWRSDGTEAGTIAVKAIGAGNLFGLNGTLYFENGGGFFTDLWRSDGTGAGTILVKSHFVYTLRFIGLNGTLFFIAGDANYQGSQLWRSDGTEAGTTVVKDFGPGSSIYPGPTSGGTLYLTAAFTPAGPVPNELWRSDGTEAGTSLVKQIRRGILELVVAKGRILYFSSGGALWRSNGTPRGTTVLKGDYRNNGGLSPVSLTAAKSTLYFTGADKRHGLELWRSDGTRAGTTIVRDVHRGAPSSEPTNLTAVGGTLFFTAKDGRHGRELWRAGPKPCKTAKRKCTKG